MTDGAVLEVNGGPRHYSGSADMPRTVGELVRSLALDPAMVVAEVNGQIVRRADFSSAPLASGDKVELVRFVGGG